MKKPSRLSLLIGELTLEQVVTLYDLYRIAIPCEDGTPVEDMIEEDALHEVV
ncbi:hypothetical protein J6TS7_21640 [Paenibacillus dendritiformis]|uniref:hypothetical protein n=1 Tax=Paenibacillus TaxID=44249 RepID=UPI001B2D2352|nr:hypothetical protein [Paenibacillus dendritiformis]GIO78554.1 hypothetical protein J6TS7_21640 [Paenibacillus dendritiformis]